MAHTGPMTPSTMDDDGEHIEYHRDGTVWAKGRKTAGELDGYWEWFRKDGSLMRTGNFAQGRQVGEWTTYDRDGTVVKVTLMKDPL